MAYNHDELTTKLQGVQPFDPAENLMGARGEQVIAKLCAANNIAMGQPQAESSAAPKVPQNDWKQVLG
jgi:hypothetical protein